MRITPLLKLFPAPKFLTMAHAGLDISDDAIRCIEYTLYSRGFRITKHAEKDLPKGLITGGDIKDEKAFSEILARFVRENGLTYVKVSIPEEKTYLFQTDSTSSSIKETNQNIEFKLEENVPIPPAEAIFNFDFLSRAPNAAPRLSVSVVPRTYLEQYISLLRSTGAFPISFEVVPKSIIRAIIPAESADTLLIVHVLNNKAGLYITSGTSAYFTSTVSLASDGAVPADISDILAKEIKRVSAYWLTRVDAPSPIAKVVLVGKSSVELEKSLKAKSDDNMPPVQIGEMWKNILDINHYVPPIPQNQALEYIVAAGLALPL